MKSVVFRHKMVVRRFSRSGVAVFFFFVGQGTWHGACVCVSKQYLLVFSFLPCVCACVCVLAHVHVHVHAPAPAPAPASQYFPRRGVVERRPRCRLGLPTSSPGFVWSVFDGIGVGRCPHVALRPVRVVKGGAVCLSAASVP